MEILPGCDHPLPSTPRLACAHLVGVREGEFYRWYTGDGVRYEAVCQLCYDDGSVRAQSVRAVCEACAGQIEAENDWYGVGGMPAFAERPTALRFEHREAMLPPGCPPIHALAPVEAADTSRWVALGADGRLIELDFDAGAAHSLATLVPDSIQLDGRVSIQLSPDGRLAAVVETFGSRGVVVDLPRGGETMRLDRGTYHVGVSEFPAAFFTHAGRTLLAHATAWNRLDVSDPLTGELLTPRGPTSYRRGEPRPEHYLDYFHAGLSISPDQRWVVDNGWAWHPYGIVVGWDLRAWLEGNVWESEDGPTRRVLCGRSYLWDSALCWLDGGTLAVWGEGRDDDAMVPAALLFDVASGRQLRWFPGPDIEPRSALPRGSTRGWMAFDRWLFAVSPLNGTGVWDIATGERVHHDPACRPTAYHRGARQFLTLLDGGAVRLSALRGDAERDGA